MDDENHITISYSHPDGHFEMVLYLPTLFSACPKAKMPKILAQFARDEKCADKVKILLAFWQAQHDRYERDQKNAGASYLNLKQRESDLRTMVKSRKHPNGVRLNTAELDDAKKRLKSTSTMVKKLYSDTKYAYNCKLRLEYFIDMSKNHPALIWVFND